MRTTTLGRGGPEVGAIGLGCMGMTASYDMRTPRDDVTSIAVIHQALDLGMTLIDTADAYGPYTNEELVGRALSNDLPNQISNFGGEQAAWGPLLTTNYGFDTRIHNFASTPAANPCG